MIQNKNPVVTKLERQKKDPKRISIFVDEKFLLGVDSEVIFKFDVVKGMVWTENLLNKLQEEEAYRKGLKKGFDLLYRSSKTKKQLKRKLIEKEFSEDVAERVVEKMSDEGFLNDLHYSEQFIETRAVRYGAYRMRQELRLKGVSDDIIDEALGNVEQDSEYDRAMVIAQKRVGQYRSDPNEKIYSKLVAYLSRKGFSYDVVKKAVRAVMEEL